MRRYIIWRLWTSIPVIVIITVITFAFINLAPGDPIDAMIDPERASISPEAKEQARRALGLHEPVPVRYVKWLGEVARGNLGYSYANGLSVGRIVRDRIGPTFLLMGAATLIAIATGVPLGILSALRQYSKLDYFFTTLALAGVSIPGFFVALAAIYALSLRIAIFPSYGMSARDAANPVLDVLWHLILPALVLGLEGTASYLRYTRASMLEVIRQEYVTTARAKGLAERLVLVRHALRNALIPIVTIIGLQIPRLFGGAVLIETIFAWPGMGLVLIEAVGRRDYPMLMGLNLMTATVVLVSNFLTDISYALLDPRIRYR